MGGGSLALANGDVNDLVRSAAVSGGIYVGSGGLLIGVRSQVPRREGLDAGGNQIERTHGRDATERIEEVSGVELNPFPCVPEVNSNGPIGKVFHLVKLGIQKKFRTFVPKGLFNYLRGLGGKLL